ncbi:MAG: SMI1/KNR4 family protein [Pyrinomonadaceae bacterium]|jgi:hypothetical protein|nr:SMI1/KNR4 family protein [Pyrinomonadaceae bacterium]
MWRELVSNLSEECEFNPPAVWADIDYVKRELEIELPTELVELLKETNGISGEYGLGLIWTSERILTDNKVFRNTEDFKDLYMPFDCLLFFADAGNGDQFAYSILDGEIRRNDIFVWNHEDDSRTWVASNLKQFLEWSLTGKIKY